MQTQLDQNLTKINLSKADDILRSCVHCGFCLSTCPTYQLTGSELDSPRGRIYLIKNALEGQKTSDITLHHLDRCLTCRACETTCPSGVQYGQLLGIGLSLLNPKRTMMQKLKRLMVRKVLTMPSLFFIIGQLKQHSLQTAKKAKKILVQKGSVLLLSGCVQPNLAPNINASAKQVLMRLGFEVLETPLGECCGAIDEHLSAKKEALIKIKTNLTNWCECLDNGVDTIISTASGCGAMVKDYQHLFDQSDQYFIKAKRVVRATQDISEFIAGQINHLSDEERTPFKRQKTQSISLHMPCTLTHAQQLPNILPDLLSQLNYQVSQPTDNHICCGSAGTYSIFQPELSNQLKQNKLAQLQQKKTKMIVTANIGCLMHLQSGTKTKVKHWIELLAK